ncbi:MAG: hypothetical protein B6242_00290 [Anaerolineaceae bacterium 4572_78]|nr:MAG: hypothetical protein B6242_00290 [Anaerolineaceae bacterium 4572_78]
MDEAFSSIRGAASYLPQVAIILLGIMVLYYVIAFIHDLWKNRSQDKPLQDHVIVVQQADSQPQLLPNSIKFKIKDYRVIAQLYDKPSPNGINQGVIGRLRVKKANKIVYDYYNGVLVNKLPSRILNQIISKVLTKANR